MSAAGCMLLLLSPIRPVCFSGGNMKPIESREQLREIVEANNSNRPIAKAFRKALGIERKQPKDFKRA